MEKEVDVQKPRPPAYGFSPIKILGFLGFNLFVVGWSCAINNPFPVMLMLMSYLLMTVVTFEFLVISPRVATLKRFDISTKMYHPDLMSIEDYAKMKLQYPDALKIKNILWYSRLHSETTVVNFKKLQTIYMQQDDVRFCCFFKWVFGRALKDDGEKRNKKIEESFAYIYYEYYRSYKIIEDELKQIRMKKCCSSKIETFVKSDCKEIGEAENHTLQEKDSVKETSEGDSEDDEKEVKSMADSRSMEHKNNPGIAKIVAQNTEILTILKEFKNETVQMKAENAKMKEAFEVILDSKTIE